MQFNVISENDVSKTQVGWEMADEMTIESILLHHVYGNIFE